MRYGLLACASSLTLVTLMGAAPAFAQANGASPASSAPAQAVDRNCPPTGSGESGCAADVNSDGTKATAGGDIVVTGSRIRSRNLDHIQPTITTDRTYLDDRNLTNAADALNESPAYRGSVTPNGAQGSFGQGVNFVNNYGLGSNRTLVLVNGRRFVTSNPATLFGQGSAGTQVDLNVINTLLIDHVDTVSIGGAPIYGSDAISGTTNFILRDRFNGLTVTGLSGITEQGDGFRYDVSALAGHDYLDGRANITVAFQHDRQEGILYNDRGFLQENLGGATNPTDAQAAALGRTAAGITALNDGRVNTTYGYNNSLTDGVPGTIQIRNESIYYLTQGGLLTSATGNPAAVQRYQFNSNGSLVPFNQGTIFPSIYASGGDGFKFSDYSQVTSNVNRDIANVFAHFDVAPSLKFFFEGEYFHSRGDNLVTQPTFNSNLFGGASGALRFFTNSPFLTAQARTQLTTLGITQFQVSRASVDLADTSGFSTTNLGRVVVGARGDFDVGSRHYNYEVSGNYGRNVIRDTSQDVNAQHFVNAVNVTTNAAGQVVCNTAVTAATTATPGFLPIADAACVPLNLLGSGVSSAAARAYVISQNDTYSLLQEAVFNANVGGSPFSVFGNDYAFNLGYEHRDERASFTPSNFQQLGLGRSTAIAPVAGKYSVNEFFGEVRLPLIQPDNNIPFINRLEATGSGRYVRNTVNGNFFAWSGGGTFAPVRDIAFRANYTKSFRAPAITELFLPRSPGFVAVPDLCSAGNINGGAAPANRQRNCAAFLAAFPNATPLDAAAATVPSVSGGNPNLQNEVARSFSYGVVLQPRFVPGLTITADYIDIRISNPIQSLTVATIASACFDNANFNTADPANGNAFCSQIRRYTAADGGTAANGGSRAGQVVNDPANPGVQSGFVNGNKVLFSGIQGTMDYSHPLDGLGIPGSAGIGATALYVRSRTVDITGVAPVRTDGTFGDPKFQAQANIRYTNDVWGITSSVNVYGRQIAARTGLSDDLREFNVLNPFAVVNGSIFFNVQKQFRLTFAVSNIGNRYGQAYFGSIEPVSYTTGSGSDLFGRRFSVSAKVNY